MAVAPVLVVSVTFNPPDISIVGPIQESTVTKLNAVLPNLTSISCKGRRDPPQLEFKETPVPHWQVELRGLLSDELSKLSILLSLLDCLEDEGGWGMRDCHALTFEDCEAHKMFFTKKNGR